MTVFVGQPWLQVVCQILQKVHTTFKKIKIHKVIEEYKNTYKKILKVHI